jgi:hypothetical protein
MSAEMIPDCPLSCTTAELSRWHDGERNARLHHIGEHLATCAACRERLSDYEHNTSALLTLREPDLDISRFWNDLRGRTSVQTRSMLALPQSRSRFITPVASLVAVLLLAIGFATLFHATGRHLSPASTVVVTSTTSALTWDEHDLSIKGNGAIFGDVAIAASDGQIAYACIVPTTGTGGPVQVWSTHDHGAHWMHVSDLPTSVRVSECHLTVDQLQTLTIIVEADEYPSDGAGPGLPHVFASFDRAAHWRPLTMPTTSDDQYALWAVPDKLATYHDRTYAIFRIERTYGNFAFQLAVSSDAMRTWQPLGQFLPAEVRTTDGLTEDLLVNPNNGDVLIRTSDARGIRANALWSSDDGGQQWQPVPLPRHDDGAVTLFGPGPSWLICIGLTDSEACSLDAGKSWRTLPSPPTCAACSGQKAQDFGITALFPDGRVLMTAQYAKTSSASDELQTNLYLLQPGSSTWLSLGTVPIVNGPAYFEFAFSHGELWSLAGGLYEAGKMPIYTAELLT